MFVCRYCEDSLAETVATLIWVAPRLCADVQELSQVSARVGGAVRIWVGQ